MQRKASFSRVSEENLEKLIKTFSVNKKFHPVDISIYSDNQREVLESITSIEELRSVIYPASTIIPFPEHLSNPEAPIHFNTGDNSEKILVMRIEEYQENTFLGKHLTKKEFQVVVNAALETIDIQDFLEDFKNTKYKEGKFKNTKYKEEDLIDLYNTVK